MSWELDYIARGDVPKAEKDTLHLEVARRLFLAVDVGEVRVPGALECILVLAVTSK